MLTHLAHGRARVVEEIRAAAPLMAALAAPVPARGPWLTAALNVQPAGPLARVRPRALVVARDPDARPDAAALLLVRRRGTSAAVTLLGAEPGPLPEGRPPARLLARDPEAAAHLAAGLVGLLEDLRGPWTLRLAGLPLGDPTLASLAAAMPDAQLSNSRSRRLVDELDAVGDVRRTVDPAEVERELPAVLARVPEHQRVFVRAAARLHAAIGQLEVAVVPGPSAGRPAAVLLTLLDRGPAGTDRWPWWGDSDVGGLRRELGSPSVTLTASAGLVRLGRRTPVRQG
ncbi:hypothetical protein [Modestobacter sp. SSW1-42]|uniref:hypothetical protein n=1 Tax=Modestobacter sp. SSW1-42 TaxID=596372 RepID=UPI003987EDF1